MGVDVDDGGIVVRDGDGNVELEEPPHLVVDDPDEIVLDIRQENESMSFPFPSFSHGMPSGVFFFGGGGYIEKGVLEYQHPPTPSATRVVFFFSYKRGRTAG